jgi:hypothetical protein
VVVIVITTHSIGAMLMLVMLLPRTLHISLATVVVVGVLRWYYVAKGKAGQDRPTTLDELLNVL